MLNFTFLSDKIIKGTIDDNDRKALEQEAINILHNINVENLPKLILLCNMVYNNMYNVLPLISDDLYDRLVVYAKNNNIEIPIGAPPISTENLIEKEVETSNIMRDDKGFIEVVKVVPDINNRLFYQQMVSNITPPNQSDFIRHHDSTLVNKRQRAVGHAYDMCGTLDKSKFVLNFDAQASGALQDNSVSIFERDFLYKLINEYRLDPYNLELILSLKYDGISVENTILKDEIIYSVTRGDLVNNEASDMTPIFGGMKFPRAIGDLPNEPFGIKFEYILTTENKRDIERIFNKSYVNLRNAVIGVTSGLDARLYRDYLTPVPLESSLNFPDRASEIQWLNYYYTKGVDYRWALIKGDYNSILQQVSIFVKEAESLREYMNFAYDGVVVEFNNNNIRQMMGKRGSIPIYAIAIKFDPLKRTSIFTHYTYTVGQDGSITPIAHFKPVEFFGAVHHMTTAHSYRRFMDLGLRVGDRVTLTLNNDVIVYIRKAPDYEQDPNNSNPIEEFPHTCPSCGQPLYISDSGDSAYCINLACPERTISRMANCLKKLGLKDFSTETVRALGITSLKELYNYDINKMQTILGPVNSKNLLKALDDLKNANLSDSRLIGAIGFTNIAEKTWKTILEQFPLERILSCPSTDFVYMNGIKGIGSKTINTIQSELDFFKSDLLFILYNFKYTKTPQYNPNKIIPTVCFTGFRDAELENSFIECGYEIAPSVTRNTTILVIGHAGGTSTKITKAFSLLAESYKKSTGNPKPIITWDNLNFYRQMRLYPLILTRDEAIAFIKNLKNSQQSINAF